MKGVDSFIISPSNSRLYDNVFEFESGSLIMSSSIENHEHTNREADVVSTPINYEGPIVPGSKIIVHHNVFRKYYDMRGEENYASGLVMGDIYMVDMFQVYMYKNKSDYGWTAIDPYCFVAPIANDNTFNVSSEKEMFGHLIYNTKYLESQGVYSGDVVSFRPDSEYEFNIDGKKLYRINSNNICLKHPER